VYQNKEKTLPHIIQYASIEMELEGLIRIIKKFNSANVGILLPDNQSVHKIDAFLAERGIRCECKSYNIGHPDYKETLDFTTSAVKVMTYHSAKGLQFETVIIPFYQGKHTEVDRKILYVAMTRTFKNLFILYHTPVLESPLCDVPERLYLKTE
jgi:superfamily I DNA/RNA helicase